MVACWAAAYEHMFILVLQLFMYFRIGDPTCAPAVSGCFECPTLQPAPPPPPPPKKKKEKNAFKPPQTLSPKLQTQNTLKSLHLHLPEDLLLSSQAPPPPPHPPPSLPPTPKTPPPPNPPPPTVAMAAEQAPGAALALQASRVALNGFCHGVFTRVL